MGKTKTAVIVGVTDEAISGKAKYEKKQAKKREEEAKLKKAVAGLGLKGGERIKVIGAELPPEEVKTEEPASVETSERQIKVRVRSKKYVDARSKIDKNKTYPISEAIKLVKDTSYSKFDGTMELHLIVRKTGISENVTLPHFAGRQKKVEIADDKTIEKLSSGKIDFDVLLATADMMPKLVPFARLLGPKGLMPNPKTRTLIKSKKDIEKFSGNSITIKTEKEQPIVHTSFGKVSQKDEELGENVNTILEAVNRKQILKAYLKSTMSPSVKLQV